MRIYKDEHIDVPAQNNTNVPTIPSRIKAFELFRPQNQSATLSGKTVVKQMIPHARPYQPLPLDILQQEVVELIDNFKNKFNKPTHNADKTPCTDKTPYDHIQCLLKNTPAQQEDIIAFISYLCSTEKTKYPLNSLGLTKLTESNKLSSLGALKIYVDLSLELLCRAADNISDPAIKAMLSNIHKLLPRNMIVQLHFNNLSDVEWQNEIKQTIETLDNIIQGDENISSVTLLDFLKKLPIHNKEYHFAMECYFEIQNIPTPKAQNSAMTRMILEQHRQDIYRHLNKIECQETKDICLKALNRKIDCLLAKTT